jgi:3-oxoacyl-[acyl-carrier protein] reductase
MDDDWARPEPLAGRSGLVTGAGHGIGREIALRLAALGANVGVNYWQGRGAAEATADEIRRLGRQALLVPGDVADEAVVRSMIDRMIGAFARIDFLVNNAGGLGGARADDPVDKASPEDWNRMLASNLTSAFLCTRYVAPGMLRRRSGRIVNISSICGLTGDCGPAYCAAKAGLLGLTRHAAVWLAPYVQVNAILPGFVASQPHDAEKVGRITPGKKLGRPEEIADLAAYLIAAPQSFLTGACIVMDGSVTNGVIARSMDWDDIHERERRLLDG